MSMYIIQILLRDICLMDGHFDEFEDYQPRLEAYARDLKVRFSLPRHIEPQDLVNETLALALSISSRQSFYDGSDGFVRWLCGIQYRIASGIRQNLGAKKRTFDREPNSIQDLLQDSRAHFDEFLTAGRSAVSSQFRKRERDQILFDCIWKLSGDQPYVIWLVNFMNLSRAEISRETGWPEHYITNTYWRAMPRLRRLLRETKYGFSSFEREEN